MKEHYCKDVQQQEQYLPSITTTTALNSHSSSVSHSIPNSSSSSTRRHSIRLDLSSLSYSDSYTPPSPPAVNPSASHLHYQHVAAHPHQKSSSSSSSYSSYSAGGSNYPRVYRGRTSLENNEGYYPRPNSVASTFQLELEARNDDGDDDDDDGHDIPRKSASSRPSSFYFRPPSSQTLTAPIPATAATATAIATKTLGSPTERESNEAFDRICSLLNHLIVDASTAVETTPAQSDLPKSIRRISMLMPTITPLIFSDSDESSDDLKEVENKSEAPTDTSARVTVAAPVAKVSSKESSVQQQQRQKWDEQECLLDPAAVNLSRDDRRWDLHQRALFQSRRSSRSFLMDKDSRENRGMLRKRRSLFLELQDCCPAETEHEQKEIEEQDSIDIQCLYPNADAADEFHEGGLSTGTTHDEGSLSSSSSINPVVDQPSDKELAWTKKRRPTVSILQSSEEPTVDGTIDADINPPSSTQMLRPPMIKGPRRCSSFPSMKAEIAEKEHAEKLQQVIQHMDSELDRTVETIEGLTRDLIAAATHQSWMQMRLERTMQLQGMASEQLERTYEELDSGLSDTEGLANWENKKFISFWQGQRAEDEDEDLDLDLDLEGDELERDDSTTPRRSPIRYTAHAYERRSILSASDTIVDPGTELTSPVDGQFPARDLAKYFEALDSISAMTRELEDGQFCLNHGDDLALAGSIQDSLEHQQRDLNDDFDDTVSISQRSSGSSMTLANNSFRFSDLSDRSLEQHLADDCTDYRNEHDGLARLLNADTRLTPATNKDELVSVNILSPLLKPQSGVWIGTGNNSLLLETPHATDIVRRRIRRSIIPAAWPTATTTTAMMAAATHRPSNPSMSDLESNADTEGDEMMAEDVAAVMGMIKTHLHSAFLVFWTAAFILATMIHNPTLAETSGRRVRQYMAGAQKSLAWTAHQDEEDSRTASESIICSNGSSEAVSSSRLPANRESMDPIPKDLHCRRSSTSSNSLSASSKNRLRRLNHQRRQRDWRVASVQQTPTQVSNQLCYGSPIIQTVTFCSNVPASLSLRDGAEVDMHTAVEEKEHLAVREDSTATILGLMRE
ncbi:hypothetical protein EDD11_006457 [Mortierella claussenii]|nr:hypothetical protein EDD11_006457 [Mortierella claussenii]